MSLRDDLAVLERSEAGDRCDLEDPFLGVADFGRERVVGAVFFIPVELHHWSTADGCRHQELSCFDEPTDVDRVHRLVHRIHERVEMRRLGDHGGANEPRHEDHDREKFVEHEIQLLEHGSAN